MPAPETKKKQKLSLWISQDQLRYQQFSYSRLAVSWEKRSSQLMQKFIYNFCLLQIYSNSILLKSLTVTFIIGLSTMRRIIIDTCKATWCQLVNSHMPGPSQQLLRTSKKDSGDMNGKYCWIWCSNSLYSDSFCYYKQNQIKTIHFFLLRGIGNLGDGITFATSTLLELLETKMFNMPSKWEWQTSNLKCNSSCSINIRQSLKQSSPGIPMEKHWIGGTHVQLVFTQNKTMYELCI